MMRSQFSLLFRSAILDHKQVAAECLHVSTNRIRIVVPRIKGSRFGPWSLDAGVTSGRF